MPCSPPRSAAAQPAAGPGGASFEEDPPRRSLDEGRATPLLHLGAFEGRLDWLLELVRARKVDLARLSLVGIADQLTLALVGDGGDQGGDGGAGRAPLPRRSEWVVMGATLAELRSRLLLPEDAAAGRQAREAATDLRDQLVERARMLAVVDWLDGQAQLGRDVFARGAPTIAAPTIGAHWQRTTDLTALLRTCHAALQAEVARGERYRPRLPLLWRVPDAMARIRELLPEMLAAVTPDGANLWRFLPGPEALEALAAAGRAPGGVPDAAPLRRSAVASTLLAGLELARDGALTLAQDEAFAGIQVRATRDGAAELSHDEPLVPGRARRGA